MKILFAPVGIISGLIAGQIGKKIFDQVWGVIDDREPPEAEHRYASWGKVLLAAALQGAEIYLMSAFVCGAFIARGRTLVKRMLTALTQR